MPKRADVLMVESGIAQSRERAKTLIMEGVVYHGEVKVMHTSPEKPILPVTFPYGNQSFSSFGSSIPRIVT